MYFCHRKNTNTIIYIMAKKASVRNRTNKNTETPSAIKRRKEARDNGRDRNSAYTAGARSASRGDDNAYAMMEKWRENQSNRGSNGRYKKKGTGGNVQTITSSVTGRMSDNGRTAGGSTNTFTYRDENGERHSGRGGKLATRRQRYYDIRVGLGLAGG